MSFYSFLHEARYVGPLQKVLLNAPVSSYKNEYYLHLYVKCKYMFCFDLFTGRNGIRLSWRSSRPRLWRRPWKGAGCFPPSSSFKIHLFITFNTWPVIFLHIPHLFAKRSSGVILYKLLRNCFDALYR